MAVKNPHDNNHRIVTSAPIRDYWPRLKKRLVLLVISMQILTVTLVGSSLVLTDTFPITSIPLWISLIAVGGASIGVNLIIFSIATEPTKNILYALTHIAGEPTTTTPPNPNAKQFAKTGLKEVLQTIYEMSVAHDKNSDIRRSNGAETVATKALANTSSGFIVLDKNRSVVYHNKSAPVVIDQNNNKVLDLIFLNKPSLHDWLEECEESAVHAEKIWTRISNKLSGEEDRRIFDIVASYQKGSEAETVLTLFDRTSNYMPEEDDMDFIAFAAHELRGPITVIRGYLDVLQDEIGADLDQDQAILIERLIVSANRLTGYVNNILNASRYDRRHLKMRLAEDSISVIYDTIKDDMQLRAASQNRLLSVSIPVDLPTVAADRSSISEVLGNLVDNALKYSNEGGSIEVTARTAGDFVEVEVTDHGIGMPANVISNLFHKFYRSHRSRETVAGTGIGLYISKGIVESHGGTISVRSAEGVGSTFTFTLPIYATVADKLRETGNLNDSLISQGAGWIKNHSMYRG